MRFISPWDHNQGERALVETVLPSAKNSARGGSVPRNVGSVLLRNVGFIDVTFQ